MNQKMPTSMIKSNFSEVGHILRQIIKFKMKSKKIKYKDLAEKLGYKLLRLKRLMTSQDFRLEEFVKVCEALDISIYQILDFDIPVEVEKQNLQEYTLDQEKLLTQSPKTGLFF